MTSSDTLESAIDSIVDPAIGEPIGALNIVDEIDVDGTQAVVSLRLGTPFDPNEQAIVSAVETAVERAGLEPDIRLSTPAPPDSVLADVDHVIAVASGKGGVGKTTVAGNIAAGIAARDADVGLLDADIHGPNAPAVLGAEGPPGVTADDALAPPEAHGVKVMSMDFLVESPDDPAILRGPMVNNVMMHFLENVHWGSLDLLVVDLPPGTGDASLDLLQTLPVDGTVIVTTPQELAVADARKGLRLFEKHDTPILGVVENMSYFQCDECDAHHDPFGEGGGARIAAAYEVEHLASLPIHDSFDTGADRGPVAIDSDRPAFDAVDTMVEGVATRLGEVTRRNRADPTHDRTDVDQLREALET